MLLLNGGVFAGAYRFARLRGGNGVTQAICDAFLLTFLVEYISVALPGAAGVFSVWSMSLFAAAAALALWIGAGTRRGSVEPVRRDADRFGLLACGLFTAGFIGAYAWFERWAPPLATDSIVYHLPTVIQWMQTGRLGVYPSWYWNPAASYSPATGMTFMAWLMEPAGCDVFVRFVQVPPLLFIFFLTVRFCRIMGCARTAAGLLGIAATLSRSLFSEALIPKDDLFITAFVAAAVLSLPGDSLKDRLGPWRVGIAFGFVLASKYTVLLVCPVFLFMIDAPFRAHWRARQVIIAVGIVLVMAGPWYLRNVGLTGNPLYPVDVSFAGVHLRGLFATERDQQLRSAGGVWRMLAHTYHSLPAIVIALLLAGWIAACLAGGRTVLRDPLRRACAIGSVATLIVFLVTSPHHEVRYVFPFFVLWFAVLGMAVGGWVKNPRVQAAAAFVPAAISTATSFDRAFAGNIAIFTAEALGLAAAVTALVRLQMRVLHLQRRSLALAALGLLVLLALTIYVCWHAYVSQYLALRPDVWAEYQYPRQGPLWKFVEEQLPADTTAAYANTFFVYPLYDARFQRRVIYAPVRRGLHDFWHLPRMGDRVPGDLILEAMAADMNADPDRATWIENLRAAGAAYLVIDKREIVPNPPELLFARGEPQVFKPVYEDPRGVVFRIDWERAAR